MTTSRLMFGIAFALMASRPVSPAWAKSPELAKVIDELSPTSEPTPDDTKRAAPEEAKLLLPDDVSRMSAWVGKSGDNLALPYMIIDKTAATIFVFNADGEMVGDAPALLGEAIGDETAPGIGDRELSEIGPEDRTTPAGRFLAQFGPASGHKRVLWIDYDSSVALHPVVTANKDEHRLERLQSPKAEDNRITYGCINVSPLFYRIVRAAFHDDRGMVYILPESEPLSSVFPALGN